MAFRSWHHKVVYLNWGLTTAVSAIVVVVLFSDLPSATHGPNSTLNALDPLFLKTTKSAFPMLFQISVPAFASAKTLLTLNSLAYGPLMDGQGSSNPSHFSRRFPTRGQIDETPGFIRRIAKHIRICGIGDEYALSQHSLLTFDMQQTSPSPNTVKWSQQPVGSASATSLKACLLANGLAYGPFRDGEGPGNPLPFPTRDQIDEDLAFISKIAKNIRTYGSSDKFADIPGLAKQHGLGVMLGINLGENSKANDDEINSAVSLAHEQITLANGKKVNLVDSIIVGNETLSNSGYQVSTGSQETKLPEAKKRLISYIHRVKENLAPSKIPVSTAQVASVWDSNLDLAREVDFVVAHFYPFWNEKPPPVERAAAEVLESYKTLKSDLRTKYGHDITVIIGETGWPSGGGRRGEAIPSPENQRRFIEEFMRLACDNSIDFYYFEAFDEEWKWPEGGPKEWEQLQRHPKLRGSELPDDRTFIGKWIGSSWGIFQSNGKLKPQLVDLFDQPAPGSRLDRDIFIQSLGPLLAYYDMGVDTWPDNLHNWVWAVGGELKMSYPSNQHSGAVFITVGKPTQPPRPWKDFSEFDTLSVEMRGERGGEKVDIGIKSRDGPDNGNETMIVKTLTTDYRRYTFPLRSFESGYLKVPEGLRQLNVVVEFVFQGSHEATVYARNIRYEPKK